MEKLSHWIYFELQNLGMSEAWAKHLNMLILLAVLVLVLFLVDFIIRKIIINTFGRLSSSSKTTFDDFLVRNKTPRNIAHIAPILIAYHTVPFIFRDFPLLENIVFKAIEVFGIILFLWIIRSVLNFAFSIITGMELWKFLTALGTASAVIILVFRDTILGFVASIQVSINDMVRIGDWITFEKYGADGDVIEINLSTVKVQNFDKTITTIPTYALISDSFRNWRGMSNASGRRIKRALLLKQESIHFLSENELEALKDIKLLAPYLQAKEKDIQAYNSEHAIDKSILINGRNLTNVGVFRKYIDLYLNNHSGIHKEMTIMARQLAPTSQGLPIEIYAFSTDKRWENYEYIMADIFDHLIAAVPYFNLEGFELPSSTNFKNN